MAKEGEEETEEQTERRLARARKSFFARNAEKDELTEEEEEIKRLYEELDKQYNIDVINYKEYKAWCEEHGRKPQYKKNGVMMAKEGEEETEEQIEQRLGQSRRIYFAKIKRKNERKEQLTEEEEEIKKGYEELNEQYGEKQPARNIASAVKNVFISESQEADEFIGSITSEKAKEGAIHNDE